MSELQIIARQQHTIPIGTLVELQTGVRLFVVCHKHDCDWEHTPLYYLSADASDTIVDTPGFRNRGWSGGYSEKHLTVVRNG